MYNCLIADDEPVAREIIESYCSHLPILKVIKSCGNALEAKLALQEHPVDILFLDINMPVLDGLSFVKTLTKPPLVIFTTAYKEHAVAAFDLSACDYLLKPFSLERFIIAVDRAIERLAGTRTTAKDGPTGQQDFCFIKSDGKMIRIEYSDLLYAEAHGNYIRIVSAKKPILANMTFSNLEEQLPHNQFFRVHRSFIINLSKIAHIEGNTIIIDNTKIPIGSNYKQRLMTQLKL